MLALSTISKEALSATVLQTAMYMFTLTVPMTWHHLGAAAGTLGQHPMIHRGRDGIAMQIAFGLLDRGLIELDFTVHTGRGASGGKQVFRVRKTFRVTLLSASC